MNIALGSLIIFAASQIGTPGPANMTLMATGAAHGFRTAPGFLAGLIVHPLNPKAWAMITASFTNFMSPDTPALQATLVVATTMFIIQLILHPLWTYSGERIAAGVAGKPMERYLMWTLAALTVASVVFVLVKV